MRIPYLGSVFEVWPSQAKYIAAARLEEKTKHRIGGHRIALLKNTAVERLHIFSHFSLEIQVRIATPTILLSATIGDRRR